MKQQRTFIVLIVAVDHADEAFGVGAVREDETPRIIAMGEQDRCVVADQPKL